MFRPTNVEDSDDFKDKVECGVNLIHERADWTGVGGGVWRGMIGTEGAPEP